MKLSKVVEEMSFVENSAGDFEKKLFDEFSLRILLEKDSVLLMLNASKFSSFLDEIFGGCGGCANEYSRRKLQGGGVVGQEYRSFDPINGLDELSYHKLEKKIHNYLVVNNWESFSEACFLNEWDNTIHIFDKSWFALYLFCGRGLNAKDILLEYQYYKSVGATGNWRLKRDWDQRLIEYAIEVFQKANN